MEGKMMRILNGMMAVIGAIALTAAVSWAAPASAQATRTWVSGVGDDVNPCSRTAPCKTFAGAISKTAASGEINCLDPGGFGAVTITKAITIDCSGTLAGISAPGTQGIIVNAGATDIVNIRGLDIDGMGTGTHGIRFLAGAALYVYDSRIYRFNSTTAGTGNGILFAPTGASELFVINSQIFANSSTGVGSGIEVAPANGGSARVVVRDSRIIDNANIGFRLNTSGNATPASLVATLQSVEVSGNAQGVIAKAPTATTTATIMVANSSVVNNDNGVVAAGPGARIRVGNTTITGNATGVVNSGIAVSSFGNNLLAGNSSDGSFTAPDISPL
jgi:hypothetical protein